MIAIHNILNKIAYERNSRLSYDSPEAIQNRKKFFSTINVKSQEGNIPMGLEMYPQTDDEPIKSNLQDLQYFNPYLNTLVTPSNWICFEIDKLPEKECWEGTLFIACNLIENNFQFFIFHAEGQRSYWIIVPEMNELLELNEFKREKAITAFCKKIAGSYFQYLDKAVWQLGHFMPMPFAPHWRHKNTFDLVIEYLPEQEEVKQKPQRRRNAMKSWNFTAHHMNKLPFEQQEWIRARYNLRKFIQGSNQYHFLENPTERHNTSNGYQRFNFLKSNPKFDNSFRGYYEKLTQEVDFWKNKCMAKGINLHFWENKCKD